MGNLYNYKSMVSHLFIALCMFSIALPVNAQDGDKAVGVQAVTEAIDALPSDLQVPNRYALIIGASDYQDDRIPDLPACSNDALGLYSVLTDPTVGMFAKDHVTLLVDHQVSRGAVIDALDELGRQAGPNDLVLVFFSGHGAVDSRGRSYWVMQNTLVDKLRATALPENEITDLLGDIKTTRLITMIDACFSASTATLGDNKSIIDLKKIFPEFDGKGRIAMTASAGDQLSVIIPQGQPGYGYSAFAYHLIEGLKGQADGAGGQNKEGVITVDELWAYVKDRTETTARKAGGNQRPQLKGSFGSRFMLTVDSQRLVAASQSVKQQITALKALLLDDKITGKQYEQAKVLLTTPILQLDEQGQKIRKVYVDLVEGRLAAGYLDGALDTIRFQAKPIANIVETEDLPLIETIEVEQAETSHFDRVMEELIELASSNDLYNKQRDYIKDHPEHPWVDPVIFLKSYSTMDRMNFLNTSPDGYTYPLHYAAELNCTKAIEAFLELGIEVSQRVSKNTKTPIHRALIGDVDATDAVQLLLENGADPNQGGVLLFTLCNFPIEEFEARWEKQISLLVNAGADINLKIIDGTPLYHAAYYNNAASIRVLIEHGADPSIKGYGNRTPLSRAKKMGNKEAVAALKAAGVKK